MTDEQERPYRWEWSEVEDWHKVYDVEADPPSIINENFDWVPGASIEPEEFRQRRVYYGGTVPEVSIPGSVGDTVRLTYHTNFRPQDTLASGRISLRDAGWTAQSPYVSAPDVSMTIQEDGTAEPTVESEELLSLAREVGTAYTREQTAREEALSDAAAILSGEPGPLNTRHRPSLTDLMVLAEYILNGPSED